MTGCHLALALPAPERLNERSGTPGAKRFRAGDNQFDLRAHPWSAPNGQLPADPHGALSHSGNTVVAGAPHLCDFGINALTVIAHAQPQAVPRRDHDFNHLSRGMTEVRSDRLPCNTV